MQENTNDGPPNTQVAELETKLADLAAYVTSLIDQHDEQVVYLMDELSKRLEILEADLRERKDAEERERLMHEACLQAESKETDARPKNDLETLDFESLKQKWKEAGKILDDIDTGKRADPKEHVTDYYLSEGYEIVRIMEEKFPEELKALQASADWKWSPAWIAAQPFERLKQIYQRADYVLTEIQAGRWWQDDGGSIAGSWLRELDATTKEIKKRFPEEFKTLVHGAKPGE